MNNDDLKEEIKSQIKLSEIVSKLPIIISLIKSERESPSSPPAPTR